MCFGSVANYLIIVPHTFRLQGMEIGVEAKPGPDPDDIRKLGIFLHNFEVWVYKAVLAIPVLWLWAIAMVFAGVLDSRMDPKTPNFFYK